MNNNILIVIEEIFNLNTSGAIVNWHLSKIIAENNNGNTDMLTLDSINDELIKDWETQGKMFLHKKDNLKKIQRHRNILKSKSIILMLLGTDYTHYNRIINIKKFLKKHKNKYDTILFLSGGFGFTPHRSINKVNTKNNKLLGVFHDPYPMSSYPESFKRGYYWYDIFKRRKLQRSISKLDYVIFPSQRLYEWYLRDYKIDKKKVVIVPHAIEFNETLESNTSKSRSLSIFHSGTLLDQRNPISFLNEISKFNDSVNVKFIGGISDLFIEDLKKFKGCENIAIIRKRMPYHIIQEEYKKVDFMLLIESDDKNNPFLPTKFVEYVHHQKPIIALTPENSEVSRLLTKEYPFKAGINDAKEINRILNDLSNPKQVLKAKKILEGLKDYCSQEYIERAYKKMIS